MAVHFYQKRLQSGVNISDRSDGLRSGMQYLNIDHTAPDEEECATPHCSDWAHIVTHLKKGVTWSISNDFERIRTNPNVFLPCTAQPYPQLPP